MKEVEKYLIIQTDLDDTRAAILENYHELTKKELEVLLSIEQKEAARPEILHTLERCIKRKDFTGNPMGRLPHNEPLWKDWSQHFIGFFNRNKNVESLYYLSAASLVQEFEFKYGGKYDVNEIQQLLDTWYDHHPTRGYEFLRSDFIKEVEA